MFSDDPPHGVKILIIVESLTLLCYIPIVYLFYQNRKIHPINARLPLFVILLNLGIYGIASHEMLVSIWPEQYLCCIREFLAILPYMFCFTIYNYRILHLIFAYKITSNIMEQKHLHHHNENNNIDDGGPNNNDEDNNQHDPPIIVEWSENWFVRHRNLVHPRSGIWFLIGQTTIYGICIILFVGLDPTSWSGGCLFETRAQKYFRAFTIGNEIIALAIACALGLYLRKIYPDAYWLKSEFIITVWTSGFALILYAIFTGINFPRWMSAIFVLASNHCVLISGTLWPYVLSRKEKNLSNKKPLHLSNSHSDKKKIGDNSNHNNNTIRNELMDILQDPEGFQTFLSYLQTEFSSENLFFWFAVEQLKTLDPDEPSTPENAGRIYFQYIQEDAPCYIHLPAEIHETIFNFLQNLKHHNDLNSIEREDILHVFDAAQRYIYDAMAADSYPRFIRSHYYRNAMRKTTTTATTTASSLHPIHTPDKLRASIELEGIVPSTRTTVSKTPYTNQHRLTSDYLEHSDTKGNVPSVVRDGSQETDHA